MMDNRDGSEDLVLQVQPQVIQTIQSTGPRLLTLTPRAVTPPPDGPLPPATVPRRRTVRYPAAGRTITGFVFSKDFGICDRGSAISGSRQDRDGQHGIIQFR